MKYANDLILLGMGASRRLCPFKYDVPVWSCNTGYTQIAEMKGHVTKIFMAHENHLRPDGQTMAYDFKQMNMLAEHGVEIYNIHRCKGLKHKMYPLKTIIKKFDTNYFSDTICYMLAFAVHSWTDSVNGRVILKEPDKKHRITMYGIDMATFDRLGQSGEYQLEKGGVEYWIGVARGVGIKVEIGEGSFCCKSITGHPYGVKYFKLEDIDPEGLLPKDIGKYLIHG